MMPVQDAEKRKYFTDNHVAEVVEAAVESLFATQPEGKENVQRHLADHLLSVLPVSARAAVALRHTPNYIKSARIADQGGFSMIGHNMTIDVLHTEMDEMHSPVTTRKSIVSYNQADITAMSCPLHLQHVKKVVTIGPASQGRDVLKELFCLGVHVARLNLFHNNHDFHRLSIRNIRAVSQDLHVPVTIAIDIPGSQVRIGRVPEGKTWSIGEKIILSVDPQYRDAPRDNTIFVNYPQLVEQVTPGQRICISEGMMQVNVDDVTASQIICTVKTPYKLDHYRNVSLPGVHVVHQGLPAQDKEDIKFALDLQISVIFASFCQSAEDIREIRALCAPKQVTVIAKICNQAGLENFDEVLLEADGIVVSRGDLGAELPVRKLFLVQKMMVARCNAAGKPCIVASQILETMMVNPFPSRAEVNDIANAVLDGADALMLAGETAVGPFPVQSLTTLVEVTDEAGRHLPHTHLFKSMVTLQPLPFPPEESVASSAVSSALELSARAIIALTQSGSSARLLSKYFPPCPIYVNCGSEAVADSLRVVRSIVPIWYESVVREDRPTRLDKTIELLKTMELLRNGDTVILVHAEFNANRYRAFANIVRVWTIA